MNLHLHSEEFKQLITITSQNLAIEEIYVEKDYFVVLALKSLSESDHRNNGIFKGGTSLSKVYGIIKRFSEDIDLAIVNDPGEERGSQNKMEKVIKALSSNEAFTEDSNHPRSNKASSWIKKIVLNYPMLTDKHPNMYS